MIDNSDPVTWPLTTWILGVGMAFGGGFVNWFSEYKKAGKTSIKFFEWIGELSVCAFIGFCVFMILYSYAQPLALCAVGGAIGGHWSTRLIFIVENILEKRLSKYGDS